MSSIIALVYISQSELWTVNPQYNELWIAENDKELQGVLYGLGLDVNQPYETQFNTHRNRFGNLNTCTRWVGNSRLDQEWIESGYASDEAIDKQQGNSLVKDLYSLRGMTE